MSFIRRIFFIFFCIAGVFSLSAQSEQAPLVTQITIHHEDSASRFLYLYNNLNQKTLETRYVGSGETWIRRDQTEWIFNNGVCSHQYFRKWVNGNWKSVYRFDFEYKDGFLTKETRYNLKDGTDLNETLSEWTYEQNLLKSKNDYVWNGTTWVTKLQTNYVYNDSNRMRTLILKEFALNVPAKETKIDFRYNELLKVDSFITTEKQDTNWINKSLAKLYYDPVSKLKTGDFLKNWDSLYQKWNNEQNVEYVYDASGKLQFEKYQHWTGAFWVNDLQYEYRYNEAGILVKKITYLPIYNDYRATTSVNYEEFQYGKASLIESKNEFWGGETGAPIITFIPYQFNEVTAISAGSKIEISYIPVDDTGLEDIQSAKNLNQIRVYPNPSKGIFYFDNEKYDVSRWSITDVSGKLLITKEQNERSGVVDLGDFKPGVYLLQVFTPDGTKTQKLIKE